MTNKFNRTKDKWKLLKNITDKNKCIVPTCLTYLTYSYTNTKMICNISNNNCIEKNQENKTRIH